MEKQGLWTYAIPREASRPDIHNILKKEGFSLEVSNDGPGTSASEERWVLGAVWIGLTDEEALDVVLLRAAGAAAVPCAGQLLELTGFFAQSELLATAEDTDDPEAEQALATLAHMVCTWDDTWQRLFSLHLDNPPLRPSGLLALQIVASRVAPHESLTALLTD